MGIQPSLKKTFSINLRSATVVNLSSNNRNRFIKLRCVDDDLPRKGLRKHYHRKKRFALSVSGHLLIIRQLSPADRRLHSAV